MDIKRDNITTEQHWTFKCPECGEYTEIYEDPDYIDYVECEHCNETISVID